MDSILRIKREQIVGALPPPPGVIPNFEHPESVAYRIVIVTAIFLPLSTLVLSLRIYTRGMIIRSIGSDDYIIILGWLLSIAFAITSIFNINCGLGVHLWDVPLLSFSPRFLKFSVINGVFYGISFLCVKLSILLLYLRLSPYRQFRIMVYMVIVITVIYSFLGSFEFLFNCKPIAKNWDITISDGSCIDVAKILMVHSVLNIATDIAMLILPITLVRKLQLLIRQKVALAGLFMTGTLVCIVSIIRLKKVLDLVHSVDVTWIGAEFQVWTTIEVYVGIICVCLPHMKPFLRRHFPKVLGSSNASRAFTSHASRRAQTFPNTSIGGHELEPCERHQKSATRLAMLPRSKQQMGTDTDNESQEDILGDRYLKDVLGTTNAAAASSDTTPPLKKGSFRSDNSGIAPVSREEF